MDKEIAVQWRAEFLQPLSSDASSLIWTQVERFGRFFQVYFQCVFSLWNRRNQFKIEVQSQYKGMNCEQFVSSLFTKHADLFPAVCVVASAAAVLPVTNASREQGIFNPEQDFDKAAEPTFGRSPRPADENLHRRPTKQQDGLSQGFAAVAISANLPHFMSWSSALTENCDPRLSAYVWTYSNSNLLLVACSILILFLAPTLITFSRIIIYMYIVYIANKLLLR